MQVQELAIFDGLQWQVMSNDDKWWQVMTSDGLWCQVMSSDVKWLFPGNEQGFNLIVRVSVNTLHKSSTWQLEIIQFSSSYCWWIVLITLLHIVQNQMIDKVANLAMLSLPKFWMWLQVAKFQYSLLHENASCKTTTSLNQYINGKWRSFCWGILTHMISK